jgi:hypothetical protein
VLCCSPSALWYCFDPSMRNTRSTWAAESNSRCCELTRLLICQCFAVQELRDLLEPMGLLASGPSRVYCDSEAAIASVMGGSRELVRGLAKHHAVRLVKLRELIDDDLINLHPINTTDNIADILTKANPAPVLRAHLATMHAGTVWGLQMLFQEQVAMVHRRKALMVEEAPCPPVVSRV